MEPYGCVRDIALVSIMQITQKELYQIGKKTILAWI